MKKSLLYLICASAILGIAATSFSQGSVQFENYSFGATSLDAPVTMNGVRVGKEFQAQLLYSLDGGATFNLLTAAQSGGSPYPTPFAFGVGNDGDSANFAGYFFGNVVTIPGYSSGPITFIVQVFNGPTVASSSVSGMSMPFTMSSIATGTTPPSDFVGMQGFELAPEPNVFALAGLGSGLLMAFRRKK